MDVHASPAGMPAPVRKAQGQGHQFTQTRTFEVLARAGLAARGVIYAIVGVLALKLALGAGGKTADQQGALRTLVQQPFGRTMLILMAAGLLGYATWRLVRAAMGHGKETQDDVKQRLDGLASGVAYLLLFGTSLSLLLGSGGSSGGGPDKTTGGVLGWPAGRYLIIAVGVVVIGAGLEQGYKGLKRKFLDDVRTERMSESVERTYTAMGVFGHLARMVIFALIGYFLIKAAIDFKPNKAVGLDGALQSLRDASYGRVLLGAVAAGLIGFAAYSLTDARYRRV